MEKVIKLRPSKGLEKFNYKLDKIAPPPKELEKFNYKFFRAFGAFFATTLTHMMFFLHLTIKSVWNLETSISGTGLSFRADNHMSCHTSIMHETFSTYLRRKLKETILCPYHASDIGNNTHHFN